LVPKIAPMPFGLQKPTPGITGSTQFQWDLIQMKAVSGNTAFISFSVVQALSLD